MTFAGRQVNIRPDNASGKGGTSDRIGAWNAQGKEGRAGMSESSKILKNHGVGVLVK